MIFTIFRPKRIKNDKPCVARSYRGRYRLDGHDKIIDVALYTTDKRVARQRLEDIVRDKQLEATGVLPLGLIRAAAKSPLAEHLDAHLADLRAIGRTAKYVHDIQSGIERLCRECGWSRVGDVTAVSFQKWRTKQTITPKTLNDYLKAARGFFNWMHKRELIDRNPLRAVELIKTKGAQKFPRRAFTQDELARLLSVAGKYRPAYITAVFTGLRRGELAALQWDDIHLDASTPYLNARAAITKNGKDAAIALHPDVVAALRSLQAEASQTPQENVFHKLLPSMKEMRRHLKAVHIDLLDARGFKVDFHSLRHTLATNLTLAGTAPRVAMEIMRHCDLRLTMKTYTDASQLPAAAAVAKLPSLTPAPAFDSQRASQDLTPACPAKAPLDRESTVTDNSQIIGYKESGFSKSPPIPASPDNDQIGRQSASSRLRKRGLK